MKAWAWLLGGLLLLAPLQNWLDAQAKPSVPLDEALYVKSGRALKSFSFGFHALLADLYWLRAIQYFGEKLAQSKSANVANVSELGLPSLASLLNLVTELDPQHVAAYRFGAMFLPEVSHAQAGELLERGIRENPAEWRLYLDLGYLRWRQHDFAAAQAAYERGSRLPGAPQWLLALAASMAAQGGARTTAREIFTRLYENSSDAYTKKLSLARLQALRAEDELERLRRLLLRYRAQTGNCPPSLAALLQWAARASLTQESSAELLLDERGAPLDPAGFAYAYTAAQCALGLNQQSTILLAR
jgi:hypothetical protein